MRALQHVTGIVLATAGVILVLGALDTIFTLDPGIVLWPNGLLFAGLGVLFGAGGCALLRVSVNAPIKVCPQCGGTEQKPAGFLRRSRIAATAHLFGWVFAALWNASRELEVRCAGCDCRYRTGTRSTRITGILLWVLLLLFFAGWMTQWLEAT